MNDLLNEFKSKMFSDKRSLHTVRQYLGYMKSFCEAYNITSLSEITDERVREYCAKQSSQTGQAKHNGFVAALSKLKEYYPSLAIRIPERETATTVNARIPLETDEFKQLMEGIGNRNLFVKPFTTKALIAFLYYTGLRVGELETLKVADIQGKEMLMMFQNKNKSTRPIYLNQKLRDLLAVYLRQEHNGSEMLFNMKANNMGKLISKAFKEILGKKGFPHLLRHSFVTNCHREGVDIKIIQMAVGHSTIQQTENYLKVNPMMVVQQLKEKVKTIELCGAI